MPTVFPAVMALPVRQGADFTQVFTWYTDAPRDGVYVGDWLAARRYRLDDLVRHEGDVYAALTANVNGEPGVDTASWRLLELQDLTGFSARLAVRSLVAATETLLSLSDTASTPGGSGLVLGGTAGTVSVTFGNVDTAALPARPCPYDLELISAAGLVTPFLSGEIVDPTWRGETAR